MLLDTWLQSCFLGPGAVFLQRPDARTDYIECQTSLCSERAASWHSPKHWMPSRATWVAFSAQYRMTPAQSCSRNRNCFKRLSIPRSSAARRQKNVRTMASHRPPAPVLWPLDTVTEFRRCSNGYRNHRRDQTISTSETLWGLLDARNTLSPSYWRVLCRRPGPHCTRTADRSSAWCTCRPSCLASAENSVKCIVQSYVPDDWTHFATVAFSTHV